MRIVAIIAWTWIAWSCGPSYLPIGDAGSGMDATSPGTDASTDAGAPPPFDAGVPPDAPGTGSIRGVVTASPEDVALSLARVTLVDAAGAYVDEARSAPDGSYAFFAVPPGDYVVGASAMRRAYVEEAVSVPAAEVRVDLALGPETSPGRWSVIGDTEPERPFGTPSLTLLPDGRVMMCHNTLDPVIFDPRTGEKVFPGPSPSSQGCHMTTVLSDGRVIFVGGQARDEPAAFTEAVATVKIFDPVTLGWTVLPDMNEQRWYPTLVRLADERLLACGGGQRPDARRTAECEVFDPSTQDWTVTGPLTQPTEYSPSALLYTGDVLTTWSPPQLYDVAAGTWRTTGDFVFTSRGYPDHSDHALVLLPGGDALAVGVRSATAAMVERFDPAREEWSAGASPTNRRMRPEVVLLPDGRVLAAGGLLQSGSAPTNPWGYVATTDLYDAELDAWREVAPMALAREYHAMTLVIPDGRVITTSGTGDQASGPAPEASVEAFEPPYLFRGPRPRIDRISSTDLRRGATVTLDFAQTRAPTTAVLLGTGAVTHWMDGGVPRLLQLDLVQEGSEVRATIPADPVRAPLGYYLLFLMVDDIPSEGVVVRVTG